MLNRDHICIQGGINWDQLIDCHLHYTPAVDVSVCLPLRISIFVIPLIIVRFSLCLKGVGRRPLLFWCIKLGPNRGLEKGNKNNPSVY